MANDHIINRRLSLAETDRADKPDFCMKRFIRTDARCSGANLTTVMRRKELCRNLDRRWGPGLRSRNLPANTARFSQSTGKLNSIISRIPTQDDFQKLAADRTRKERDGQKSTCEAIDKNRNPPNRATSAAGFLCTAKIPRAYVSLFASSVCSGPRPNPFGNN